MVITNLQIQELFLKYEKDFIVIEPEDSNTDLEGIALYVDNKEEYIHLELYDSELEVQIYFLDEEVCLTDNNFTIISKLLNTKLGI